MERWFTHIVDQIVYNTKWDILFTTIVVVVVLSLAMRLMGVKVDVFIQTMVQEFRELVRGEVKPGAVNFATLLLIVLVIAGYFLLNTVKDVVDVAAFASGKAASDDTGLLAAVLCLAIIAMVLSVGFVTRWGRKR